MKYYLAAGLLALLATVKVGADIFELPRLSAAAAVTNMAPAMKVFTAHRGYETYSAAFALELRFANGETAAIRLDPESYAGLRGPYNRRNVYGALIAYGPLLVANPATRPMWREMAANAFCGESPIFAELGIDKTSALSGATIRYLGQVKKDRGYAAQLEVSCE